MSYGSKTGVASLARVWTDNGNFTASTNPTDRQVDEWLTQMSNTMDAALGLRGFTVPITNTAVVSALAGFINPIVADLCHGANASGRFFTQNAIERGVSPLLVIRKEIDSFVDQFAGGFAALGATRAAAPEDQVFTRDTDEAGNAVVPLFERKAFGEDAFTQEWDS